ncbi:MAG: hypothetical protein L6271_05690 [Desulfobacteraceae bacterium]|nr:hypothetical protein [Desulfobacteraceae bacterium]MDO8947329.1 hypothetical protein [Desulfocapsaceae bacterium]
MNSIPFGKNLDQYQAIRYGLGSGQPVVFSHGWPLISGPGKDQVAFLSARGSCCIAHGRSIQP